MLIVTMKTSSLRALVCSAVIIGAPLTAQMPAASASAWRDEAAAVGTSARVLIVGAHPDD